MQLQIQAPNIPDGSPTQTRAHTFTHKSNSFKCHGPLQWHIGRLWCDRALRQHKRYLLEHLNPFDGQTVLKSDPLTLREQVYGGYSLVYCVVIQEKGQPDITDRSYSGWHLCVWETEGEADRQIDSEDDNTHERVSERGPHCILGLFSRT